MGPTSDNPPSVLQTQRNLPFEAAPSLLRAHGLPSMPSCPLVSQGRIDGGPYHAAIRAGDEFCWGFPEVEYIRDDYRYTALCLDVDGRSAAERVREVCGGSLPVYNVAVQSQRGHFHVVYFLRVPVGRPTIRGAPVQAVRLKPINLLKRVSEFYAAKLESDPGFSGVLAHNPAHVAHSPHWGRREPFGLLELAKSIPHGWKVPRQSKLRSQLGRNCALFQDCLRFAGSPGNVGYSVLDYAMIRNGEFETLLPPGEVRTVARSAERYRAEWTRRGQFGSKGDRERSLWGRRLNRYSITKRRARVKVRNETILALHALGWSVRRIARLPGIDLSKSSVSRVVRDALSRGVPFTKQDMSRSPSS